jgi:hypothetical protein
MIRKSTREKKPAIKFGMSDTFKGGDRNWRDFSQPPVWQVEMGDDNSYNDLLGQEAGWMGEEVGLNLSGAATVDGEKAEPIQQGQQDDASDATVLRKSSDESEEGSSQAKKSLEIGPFAEAMMGGSIDPMATLMVHAI